MKKHFKHRAAAGLAAIMTAAAACHTILSASAASYQKGDINQDGALTIDCGASGGDIYLLNQYLAKRRNLTAAQLLLADVNADNKVNTADVAALLRKISTRLDINSDGSIDNQDYALLKYYHLKQLSVSSSVLSKLDNSYSTNLDQYDLINMGDYLEIYEDYSDSDFFRMGDINRDGNVNNNDVALLNSYLRKTVTLNKAQLQLSDLNNDGMISSADVTKLNRLTQYQIGDVNRDGVLSYPDVHRLAQHLTDTWPLPDAALWYADFNGDGLVNHTDCTELMTYFIG